MLHSISNSQFKISILSKGAELSSIFSLITGKDYIWRATPEIWGSHAPVLFPIIGLLKNNECTIDGNTHSIPKHGFVRHNEDIILKNKTSDQLDFQLDYSNKTLKMYPYKFRFNISYSLKKNQLLVTHTVANLDSQNIHFALGAHPGFTCPIHDQESYEDYYLEFEHNENASTTLLGATGLISNQTSPVLENSKIIPLKTDLFNNDALIFKNLNSKKVSLKSYKSAQVVTVRYEDFQYLGIWAKPGAPFVCIEPWLGIADHEDTDGDFLKKDGLITLAKGTTFNASYSIEIDE